MGLLSQAGCSGGYRITTRTFKSSWNPLENWAVQLHQQDLVVPLNESAEVVRTYNSLNPDKGDFGYSWTYASMTWMFVRRNAEDLTDLDGNVFSQRMGRRDVTLTLPNGQRTTFYSTVQQGRSQIRSDLSAAPASPDAGTSGCVIIWKL